MKTNDERQMEFNQRFITSAEICDLCGVTRPTLTHLRADGLLPAPVQVGTTRCYIWERAEIMPTLLQYKAKMDRRRAGSTVATRKAGSNESNNALAGLTHNA